MKCKKKVRSTKVNKTSLVMPTDQVPTKRKGVKVNQADVQLKKLQGR